MPYSLVLPFALSLYRLALRFGSAPDREEMAARLARLDERSQRLDDEVEGRLSNALVQAGTPTRRPRAPCADDSGRRRAGPHRVAGLLHAV